MYEAEPFIVIHHKRSDLSDQGRAMTAEVLQKWGYKVLWNDTPARFQVIHPHPFAQADVDALRRLAERIRKARPYLTVDEQPVSEGNEAVLESIAERIEGMLTEPPSDSVNSPSGSAENLNEPLAVVLCPQCERRHAVPLTLDADAPLLCQCGRTFNVKEVGRGN